MHQFPTSASFPKWKADLADALRELRALIRATQVECQPIPFLNLSSEKDIGLELFVAFIFALAFDPLDETDPPHQQKLDQIDDIIDELKKEKITEKELASLNECRSEYKDRVEAWRYENGDDYKP